MSRKQDRIKAREQKKCDAFNAKYPVGSKMQLKDDFGKLHEIEVSGSASVVSMQAAAWATGFGCYLLERFIPIPHPRLSKAQQEVVDKMREGWILYAGLQTGVSWMKPAPRSKERAVVGWFDFKQLLQEGIVEPQTKFTVPNRYQLTEKYRTNEY